MELKDGARRGPGEAPADRPGARRRMLALLRERLEEAREAGQPALKLEPHDVEQLCEAAEVEEGDAAGAFRAVVRGGLVRLRGRWRENRSATRVPVYVERLTGAGLRELARSRREGELSAPERTKEGAKP